MIDLKKLRKDHKITQKALCWAVARVEASEIDATDILSARMKAMQQAIDALDIRPEIALVDGNRDKGRSAAITTPHKLVVGGDGKSASIAAASILAKVSRDRFVSRELDARYPEYRFAMHKGYGTKLHSEFVVCCVDMVLMRRRRRKRMGTPCSILFPPASALRR